MHFKGKLRIYGPIQEKGQWCPSWNSKIYSLYKDLNFGENIKIIRLGWTGHIIRMEERIPKKILNVKFHNIRSTGKPRTRWEDVVQRNAPQVLGILGWRR
jgi:hypothetical protein